MRWVAALLLLGVAAAKPISLDVHRADVRHVLHFIAADGDLNLVIDDRVQGKVTVSLTRVSHAEALRAVAATVGAAVELSGKTGLVK